MTKKNLKPQQAAPVQREINTTSSGLETSTGLTPHYWGGKLQYNMGGEQHEEPFAGDDAE